MITLERQVRIAAGLFALIGFLFGLFVNQAWHAVSGFVGAGLIFAGVTGHCGMALVMTKAPWNVRRKTKINAG